MRGYSLLIPSKKDPTDYSQDNYTKSHMRQLLGAAHRIFGLFLYLAQRRTQLLRATSPLTQVSTAAELHKPWSPSDGFSSHVTQVSRLRSTTGDSLTDAGETPALLAGNADDTRPGTTHLANRPCRKRLIDVGETPCARSQASHGLRTGSLKLESASGSPA